MNKLGSKGFSVVEVLAAIVIIGLICAVGWFVYSSQLSKKADDSKTATNVREVDHASDPYYGWNEYSKNGFEFKYPSDWELDEQSVLRLTSGNFKSTGVQKETITAGAMVSLSQTDIPQKAITADNYQNSTSGLGGSNFKKVTIGNNEVVQYHNGDMITTVFFRSDGTRVAADLSYEITDKESSIKVYNLVLSTIKIN